MRSEQEMLKLILNFAINDDAIRAVLLNGSRANPNTPKDPFQDFDIVYVVRDVLPYVHHPGVMHAFGELMILQLPEEMSDPPPKGDGHTTYLMQYLDDNRIDLSFYALDCLDELLKDSLTIVLLDKDGRIKDIPPSSDAGYLPQEPTEKRYRDCCNEFWWVSPYVAKGLWRGEPTYARHMLDDVVRPELMKMLVWHFGIRTGFRKSPGKLGKYLKADLEPEIWAMLEQTYTDLDHTWEALFGMGELFRRVAGLVAAHYGFSYRQTDDQNVTAYLWRIRNLPADSKTV